MKGLNLVLFLLIFSGSTAKIFPQTDGALTGIVQDEKNMASPYVNVTLLNAEDFSFVTGSVTEESGKFSIPSPAAGTYVLRISSIGFKEITTPTFKVPDPSFSKDFGIFALQEETTSLDEVMLVTQRPIITVETDRIVVRVEGTMQPAGNTAFDVISRSPGVWIDQNGNIQLNGKPGAQVMVNGRLTYLSAKDLQTMLRGMSAENIKNIEIISNPSARFDAEGDAGIININLVKNVKTGLNGSIYAGYEYNGLNNYSAGGNLNYKTGSWNFYTSIDAANHTHLREVEFKRVFRAADDKTKFDQDINEEISSFAPSFRFGSDYELSNTQRIGAVVNLSYQEVIHDLKTNSFLSTGNSEGDLLINSNNYFERILQNGAVNLHYIADLDSLGSIFSADLDLVRIVNAQDAAYINHLDSISLKKEDRTTILSSENPTHYDILSAKSDYGEIFRNGNKLEMGAKFSHLVSDNDLRFFFHEDEIRIIDPNRSNHFIYKEDIYAGYGNFATKLGDKLNLQVGIRVEQTIARGESLTLDKSMDRKYFDLFPSLFLKHEISEVYSVNYNYSRRIQRPDYELLNPFKFYIDPYTWAQGNPLLRPSYTDAFGVIQSYKRLNLSLNYSITKDFIAEVPVQNAEDNTTIYFRDNVDDSQNFSATLMAPLKLTRNWETSNRVTAGWQYFSMDLQEQKVENEQVFYMFQSTHNLSLPEGYRVEASAAFVGPQAWGLYQSEPQWWIDLGVKKSFLEDKLDLTLKFNDIFRSRWLVADSNIGQNINELRQYRSNQSVGINLRYSFNKGQKVDVQERDIELEELDRTTNQ